MKRVTIGPIAQIPNEVFTPQTLTSCGRPRLDCALPDRVGSQIMDLESQTTGIPAAELHGRRERLLEHVRSLELAGYVLFDEKYIQYFTSFGFLATERPVAFVQNGSGDMAVFVPEFEVERVRSETAFERVESYPEYPGTEHPMRILQRVLEDMGIRGAFGADNDGYPGILGYQGPALSEVAGASVVDLAPFIESLMVFKSEAEVALIRESAKWCEHAHRLLQQYTRPGATEAQASLQAGHEATLALLDTLGSAFGGQQGSADGVSAGYRGQIGRRSAWAHAVAHNIEFREGDVLVTETSAPIWGYNAELERAMIIGRPTDEMRRLFDHMAAAQQAAFAALRPGATCADVDNAVLGYFEANELLSYWRQHTGHAIGLRNHEAPFLDVGDHTPIAPGMVFTIEPGVYDGEVGGFRHSDTVVVTPDGIDILTDYPRDIESLTIDVL
jgi:Xaa-Pro dipeptidase